MLLGWPLAMRPMGMVTAQNGREYSALFMQADRTYARYVFAMCLIHSAVPLSSVNSLRCLVLFLQSQPISGPLPCVEKPNQANGARSSLSSSGLGAYLGRLRQAGTFRLHFPRTFSKCLRDSTFCSVFARVVWSMRKSLCAAVLF